MDAIQLSNSLTFLFEATPNEDALMIRQMRVSELFVPHYVLPMSEQQ